MPTLPQGLQRREQRGVSDLSDEAKLLVGELTPNTLLFPLFPWVCQRQNKLVFLLKKKKC